MKNFKLTIQYDGTNYSGWQIQENSLTIQQEITDAIEVILKEKVNLIGSGRTDAGVHAVGQTANFKTEKNFDPKKFWYSLNSILPSDISILKIEEAAVNFNARFDAKKRSYLYLISTYKSPFLHPYSFFYSGGVEITALNNLSKLILGKHDFTSFCKRSGEVENKICTIDTAYWKETRGFISFLIEGDRFLHGMVRTIVGTLLNAQKNNLGKEYISGIINSRERSTASEAVPAKGLFLYKVKY
ncbi:MAG: tRNA pseudouridine(38-40) synthase TruA [Ignavibacteria bacterium]